MKIKNLLMLAAVACAGTAMPAFAQHVTPANTTFTLSGLAQLTKPFPGGTTLTCNLTFDNTSTTGSPDGTGNAKGGTLGEGSNTGDPGCSTLKVQTGANFTVTGTVTSGVLWSGELDHVVVLQGTTPICEGWNLPFEIDNAGYVLFDTIIPGTSVAPGDCYVFADLYTGGTVVGTN